MSKPESIKIDPWTDFPRYSYSIITDDFVHDKLATVKVNSKGDKSTFNLKLNVKSDKAGRSVSDELKFWFSLPGGRSLFSKIKSSNYLKLHYDHGLVEQWNKKWNLYATLNCNKALENVSLRLGASNKSEHCNSDNRLRIDFNNQAIPNLTWYNRTVVTHNNFTFGIMAAYGISSKILLKNNLLFGYRVNDNSDVFIRLENKNFRKDAFSWANWAGYVDLARIDYVSKYNDIKYGLEGIVSNGSKGVAFDEALVVLQHHNKEKNWTTKARLSSKFDVSLSFKYPSLLLKDIATTTIGIHGSSLQSEKRAVKFGFQVEINV